MIVVVGLIVLATLLWDDASGSVAAEQVCRADGIGVGIVAYLLSARAFEGVEPKPWLLVPLPVRPDAGAVRRAPLACKRMPHGDELPARPAMPRAEDAFLDQYTQVRHLARRMLLDQGARNSIGPTDLAHEAWLRLIGNRETGELTPEQFRALVTVTMRHALIDRARARLTQKRGGQAGPRLPLDALELASAERFDELVAVDDAIERLRERNPGLAELVRLRFFAGLSVEETARALGTSERSVERDWTYARAQLMRLLGGSGQSGS